MRRHAATRALASGIAVLAVAASGIAAVAVAASLGTAGPADAATTALIMGASGISDPTSYPAYMPNVERYYIAPNSTCDVATCTLVPVITPEGLLPPLLGKMTFDPSVAHGVDDLTAALRTQFADHPDDTVVVFGYSQSSDISTLVKSRLTGDPQAPPADQLSFVLTANTNRPNGGLFTRFPGLYIPFLNITFNRPPTPTNTAYATTDIVFQYDPIADFPRYPINLLADLNAVMGLPSIHLSYPNPYLPNRGIPFVPRGLPGGYTPDQLQQLMSDPANRQTYGDTTYITIPANNLPLLQPLIDFGAATGLGALTSPVVDLVQPVLRVLVEVGYDRTTPYGTPAVARLFPAVAPGTFVTHVASAVNEGLRAAITDIATHATSPTTSVVAKLTPVTPAAAQQVGLPTAFARNASRSAGNPVARTTERGSKDLRHPGVLRPGPSSG